jgi:hypothetical protein
MLVARPQKLSPSLFLDPSTLPSTLLSDNLTQSVFLLDARPGVTPIQNNIQNNVNKKIQLDATIRRYLFTAKSLYMFRALQHPSSGVLKTVTATSGIGHNIDTDDCFQRGLIRTRWKEAAAPVL